MVSTVRKYVKTAILSHLYVVLVNYYHKLCAYDCADAIKAK